ncbi:MAG: hypothetical protein NTX86_03280 [Candidatus Dependentiae bacterium]|nr:hypothetical protein [Candidatus Dependentiae bacterium]
MTLLNILLTIFFSIFSTAILSYISMAVMIGPWIHSVIVILCSLIFALLGSKIAQTNRIQSIALITAGSSIGGILATGCGFAFPTLYFLNPTLFNAWLATPYYFVAIMAGLTFSAGALGLFIANIFEHKLLNVDKLPFAVGEVSYKLASIQENLFQAYQLIAGSIASAAYSIGLILTHAAQRFTLFTEFSFKGIQIPTINIPLNEFPLLLSIGFIAGTMLIVPLSIGIVSKILLMTPAHTHFFSYLSYNDFSFAFISGMVVHGAFMSMLELPKFFKGVFKRLTASSSNESTPSSSTYTKYLTWQTAATFCVIIAFLTWFKFSFMLQLYLIPFTMLCSYQLLVIGGELSLAPVARFATFVMMPALFIFNPDYIQLTLISTFVEVCGGVAVDILFGRKLGQLSSVSTKQIKQFQWLGLTVSALSVGVIFWLLITKLGLGSASLIAQRSQTRALTIQFQNFDFYAMIFGALFGAILKDFKVSPIMVLGGILMPLEWALLLVIGGTAASLCKKPEEYHPFWSGVFAVNSIVTILRAIF